MKTAKSALHLGLALSAVVLPLAAVVAAPLSVELGRCAAIETADQRLACYDALAKGAAASPAAAAPAPAPAASTRAPAAEFGEVTRKEPPRPQGPDHIQAAVTKLTVDHRGNVNVSLDNGQLWTFNNPDALLRLGDIIVIHRAALGSYLMTTASRHTYRVQRLQ